MFTILAFLTSIASLASALPASSEVTERAAIATVYTKCSVKNTVALTFGMLVHDAALMSSR